MHIVYNLPLKNIATIQENASALCQLFLSYDKGVNHRLVLFRRFQRFLGNLSFKLRAPVLCSVYKPLVALAHSIVNNYVTYLCLLDQLQEDQLVLSPDVPLHVELFLLALYTPYVHPSVKRVFLQHLQIHNRHIRSSDYNIPPGAFYEPSPPKTKLIFIPSYENSIGLTFSRADQTVQHASSYYHFAIDVSLDVHLFTLRFDGENGIGKALWDEALKLM